MSKELSLLVVIGEIGGGASWLRLLVLCCRVRGGCAESKGCIQGSFKVRWCEGQVFVNCGGDGMEPGDGNLWGECVADRLVGCVRLGGDVVGLWYSLETCKFSCSVPSWLVSF